MKSKDISETNNTILTSFVRLIHRTNILSKVRKAVKLLPVSEDDYAGCQQVDNLAFLYTVGGELDAAIAQLKYLFSIPSISASLLKFSQRGSPCERIRGSSAYLSRLPWITL